MFLRGAQPEKAFCMVEAENLGLSEEPVALLHQQALDSRLATKRGCEKMISHFSQPLFLLTGSSLSSRTVSSRVLSAYKGLTAVFGMGTGGSP